MKQHNDCMPKSITIRGVPDKTRNELAARATRSGRSLQEYLLAMLIEQADRPSAEDLVVRIEARTRAAQGRLDAEKILQYRDMDRR